MRGKQRGWQANMHNWLSKLKTQQLSLWFLGVIWFYFALVFFQLVTQDTAGNLFLQQNNAWADWALHFTQGSALAERSLLLESSPILLGAPFTYPFTVNLISALLVRAGVPFFAAFTVPSFLIVSTGITLLFVLYRHWLDTPKQAMAATVLFLCNGGVGILSALQSGLFSVEATHLPSVGIEWISVINSMFIPQRTFGLGFLVGVGALLLLYRQWQNSESLTVRTALGIGILLGLLPLIHMHTFVALALYLASVAVGMIVLQYRSGSVAKKRQVLGSWGILATTAAVVALTLMYWAYPELESTGRISWKLGWLASTHTLNWFTFWWRNWGVVPLLAVAGAGVVSQQKKSLLPWLLGGFTIFVVANLITFQAYAWDNTKLFAWSSVAFSPLAVIWLSNLWQKKSWGKWLTITLFSFSVAAGLYDALYTLRFSQHSFLMYSSEELQLSNWVQEHTEPNSVWLTSDKHNHWLYNLTGRQPVMGYQGWLWSHGYEYADIAQDVLDMFKNPTHNRTTFQKYGIEYVVVGPTERDQFQANVPALKNEFVVTHETDNYLIFAVEPQTE